MPTLDEIVAAAARVFQTRGLLGMLNWLHRWYDPRGRLGVREVADQFATLALAGLAAPAPKPRAARKRRR